MEVSYLIALACAASLSMGAANAAKSDEDVCVIEYGKALTKIIKLYTKSGANVCSKDADPAVEGPVLIEKLNKVVDKYNSKVAGKICDEDLSTIVNFINFNGDPLAELNGAWEMTGYSEPANGSDVLETLALGCNGNFDLP